MAEVVGTIGLIYTSAQILGEFASYTSKWRLLSDRLFDIQEGLDAAELTLESWKRKYDVQERRPIIYMHVLFGKLGWERMSQTLGNIRIISKILRSDIDKVVGRALAAGPARTRNAPETVDGKFDKELVQDCLHRIRRNTSWSRKFQYSVLGRADNLELQLERLHRKIGMLERFSDYYLEKEHPEVFHTIKRLPGRRVILKVGDGKADSVQNNLLDALSARKDAELLHQASGQGNQVHIGLSVPQVHKRDFAFLLELAGQSHEIHVHPVRIKAIGDRSRVASEIAAVPKLLRDTQEACYMLPTKTKTEGFKVSVPPRKSLLDLAYKDPLSTIIRDQNSYMSQQILYPQDQIAIACGIAQGSFRLIGSQWLQFLDCRNVRWRRSVDGRWTSMMAATPGDTSTTRTLERCKDAAQGRRDKRDLSKHIQIFRIGLLLAELALKTPISYIDYDAASCTVKIYISSFNNDGEPLDATEIAEEVQNKTNVLMGNIVFFCLSALQEKDKLGDREIEASYYREVLKDADELEAIVKSEKKRSNGNSGAATPMSGRSFGSGVY